MSVDADVLALGAQTTSLYTLTLVIPEGWCVATLGRLMFLEAF